MKKNFHLSIFIITFLLCFVFSIGNSFAEKGTDKDRKAGEKTQGDRWHRADRSKFYQKYADKWQKDHQIVILMHYIRSYSGRRMDEYFTYANTDLECKKITGPRDWDYFIFRDLQLHRNVTRTISPRGDYTFTRDRTEQIVCYSDVVTYNFAFREYVRTVHYKLVASIRSYGVSFWSYLSPDGNKIMYFIPTVIPARNKDDEYFDRSVSIFDLSKPTSSPPAGFYLYRNNDFPLSFSPNGKFISCHQLIHNSWYGRKPSEWDIIVYEADNPDNFLILETDDDNNYELSKNEPHLQYNEQWSWDGKNILYSRVNKQKQGVVSAVNLKTGKVQTLLTIDKVDYNWYPELEWTKKGILITCNNALYFKGNQDKKVKRLNVPVKTTFLFNGRLSPEGERVLFVGFRDGSTYLFVYSMKNGNVAEKKLQGRGYHHVNDFFAAWTFPDRNAVISETNITKPPSSYGAVDPETKQEEFIGVRPLSDFKFPEDPPSFPDFIPFRPDYKPPKIDVK